MPSADASGALTFDFGGQNQGNSSWSVFEITGAKVGNNGGDAVVQHGEAEWDTTNTGASITLSSFASTVNAAVAAFRANLSASPSVEGGYTSVSATTANQYMTTEFKASQDTTPSFSWSSENNTGLMWAAEIAQSQARSWAMVV